MVIEQFDDFIKLFKQFAQGGGGGIPADLAARVDALENKLTDHIDGDAVRWQQLGDITQNMYQMAIKAAQEVYAGTIPDMDMDRSINIMGANGLVNLLNGQEYEVTSNGFIVVVYQALLGVAPNLQINGDTVDYSIGLSLLGSGQPSEPIQVSTGDIITATGVLGLGSSFNITYYQNK